MSDEQPMNPTTKLLFSGMAFVVVILLGMSGTLIADRVSSSDNDVDKLVDKMTDLTRSIDQNTNQLQGNAAIARANSEGIVEIRKVLRERDKTVARAEENEERLNALESEIAKGGRFTMQDHLEWEEKDEKDNDAQDRAIVELQTTVSIMNERIAELEGRLFGQ